MTDTQHTLQLRSGDQITALRRHRMRVDVVRGPDKKKREEFDLDRVVFGSHEACDFVLSDPTVSRQHFEIVLVPEGYRIRDLDSLNGIHIDGMRTYDVVVERGTTVDVGSTRIKITAQSDTVDLPLPTQTAFGPLLGRSAAMRRVFDVLSKVAPTMTTVLLTGESGTGKEVAARAIHEGSARTEGPFVVVDCAALPPTLIESELYGHERGAFTGADRSRKGAFVEAAGGTLFLDEIGELPLDLQTRLLGAIERRQVQPLGGSKAVPIDVRLIAATNRDLRREVNKGAFRADLYFRLAVVTVSMPSLRERPEDIRLYVDSFLREFTEAGQPFSISAETMEELSKRQWAGNVRELRNALERAAALGELADDAGRDQSKTPATGGGDLERIAADVDPAVPFKNGKALLVASYERLYVEALMKLHSNNITRAARAAEIDRVYLLRLLDKFNLRPTKRKKTQ